jgi:hypothetical protein
MNLTTAKQIKMMTTTNKANFIRIGLGFGALVLGFVEYIFSRPLDSFYLGKIIFHLMSRYSDLLAVFYLNLSTRFHLPCSPWPYSPKPAEN